VEQTAIRDILKDLANAQRALRESSHAFDDAMDGLTATIRAIGQANRAQGAAIEAVIDATNKALSAVNGQQQ